LQEIVDGVWDDLTASHVTVGSMAERVKRLPDAAAGANGGVPTVDANNYVAGMQGSVVNTLDEIAGAAYVEATHALDAIAQPADNADAVWDEPKSGHVASGSTGEQMDDRYWAKFIYIGGATVDKYRGIRWYKNDEPIDSGITSPLIRVISADDGTDLISETTLTEAGSSHLYRYDATGSELATENAGYVVRLRATIDGQVRVFEEGLIGAV
jgi:hypothetical protein